jgi:Ser-tRNA(Ala) deacylase AlaX
MLNHETAAPTELRYLTDASQLALTSTLTGVLVNGDAIKFSTTVSPFYCKGGGQRADSGFATTASGRVRIDDFRYEEGIAYHIGQLVQGDLQAGEAVLLEVDEQNRLRNSAYHTAGELIIAAMKLLRFDVEILSAIHYGPQQSRIEFDLDLENELIDVLKDQLQRKLNHLIYQGGQVQLLLLAKKEEVITQVGYYPDYVTDEIIRVVKVLPGVTGRPCKGTHLQDLNQLKKLTIDKLKVKSHKLMISYTAGL